MRRGAMTWTAALGLLACQPGTSRPSFQPVPEAATVEVRLPPREATRLLADALRADSIPTKRVDLRDTWLETSWFDPATGRRTGHRPIGGRAVMVRAWSDPTHPGNSKLTVETVYRAVADPSLPERELDRQVPRDHPVAIKIRAALQDLVKRYGGPPAPAEPAPAPQVEPGGDEQPADQGAEPPEEQPSDTTQ
jgi:hypothetical protein